MSVQSKATSCENVCSISSSGRRSRSKLKLAFSVMCLLWIVWFLCSRLYTRYIHDLHFLALPPPDHLVIDTEACKIPGYRLWDDSIKNMVQRGSAPNCRTDSPKDATYVDNDVVYLILPNDYNVTKCFYGSITRYNDMTNVIKEDPAPFTDQKQVNSLDEYVRIRCITPTGEGTYANYYTFPRKDASVNEASKKAFAKHKAKGNDEYLSILLLGVDSLSRPNAVRQYSETRSFVVDEMGAVEMKGHVKLGENSFPNMTPFMAGQAHTNVAANLLRYITLNKFDNWPFVWKDYRKAGYNSYFAEDDPPLNVWNMEGGFKDPPADRYFRPIGLEIDTDRYMWSNWKLCFGRRSWTDMTLQYLNQSMNLWNGNLERPYFVFHFSTGDSPHREGGGITCDKQLVYVLRDFKRRGFLNNTLLVFFGDHGVRWGDFPKTMIGKLEGRLPALFFSFPEWFRKKYPQIMKNLRTNANRLTSHFDVYKTLKSFVNFRSEIYNSNAPQKVDPDSPGISLLHTVPSTRSCVEAGIPQHWCPCTALTGASVETPQVKMVATHFQRYVMGFIRMAGRDLKSNAGKCAYLELASIEQAFTREITSKSVGNKKPKIDTQYMVTIKTMPGGALLSGSGIISGSDPTNVTVSHEFTRINTYGDQSRCVKDPTLKLICFCKED